MYSYLYDNYNKNDIMYFTLIILLIADLPLIFFTILDILQFTCLDKYRINYNNIRKYPTKTELKDGLIESCKSFFGIILPISFIGIFCGNTLQIYPYNMSRELPNILVCLFHIICIFIMSDILFYIFHRTMHIPFLYKNIHKVHHKYKETFALVNHYLHPLETIIFFFPAIIPPLILQSHITIMWFCAIIMNWNGIIIHSGYDFSIKIGTLQLPAINEHDKHHMYFNYNYGAMLPFMDKLCGTYK